MVVQKLDFDFFDFQSYSIFECFVEGFEAKVKYFESQLSEVTGDENGINFINEESGEVEYMKNQVIDDYEDPFNDTASDIVSVSFNIN